ncbi:MAG: radical SAM protein [Desulfobacteraceae bacterium]|jgi:pyruvate formate lyase activating enzyme
MNTQDYLYPLANCTLCEHRCGANRLAGQTGVCRMTLPAVASATLHPAPPESYTVFTAGCNYKCLNCQNWTIAQIPDNGYPSGEFIPAAVLARQCVDRLASPAAKMMGADRIFFSGGEPTIHLPYIEQVVADARKRSPNLKVNFDTNGYLTRQSLKKVLGFTTSITYDIKAFNDDVHLALTGTSSGPVLRNAETIGRHAKDKLWEYRILVIPTINEQEIAPLCRFIAGIDPRLPVCFLAFRPNYALERHAGATAELMDRCVRIARSYGLSHAYWAGQTGIPGSESPPQNEAVSAYRSVGAQAAGAWAFAAGCRTHPRNCVPCSFHQACAVKRHVPRINT